jgi:hypothetical protein
MAERADPARLVYAINAISSNEMHFPFRERLPVSPVGKSDGNRYRATPVEVFAGESDHP